MAFPPSSLKRVGKRQNQEHQRARSDDLGVRQAEHSRSCIVSGMATILSLATDDVVSPLPPAFSDCVSDLDGDTSRSMRRDVPLALVWALVFVDCR